MSLYDAVDEKAVEHLVVTLGPVEVGQNSEAIGKTQLNYHYPQSIGKAFEGMVSSLQDTGSDDFYNDYHALKSILDHVYC